MTGIMKKKKEKKIEYRRSLILVAYTLLNYSFYLFQYQCQSKSNYFFHISWVIAVCAYQNQVWTCTLLGNVVRFLVSCLWNMGELQRHSNSDATCGWVSSKPQRQEAQRSHVVPSASTTYGLWFFFWVYVLLLEFRVFGRKLMLLLRKEMS